MPIPAARGALASLLACALAAAPLPPRRPLPAPLPPCTAPLPTGSPNVPAFAVVVAGTVRDEGGGPIAGASVTAARRAGGEVLGRATTDAAGAYRIAVGGADIPDSITLTVRRIGYGARTLTLAVAGGTVQGDVILAAQSAQLQQVVVPGGERMRSDRRARHPGADAAVPNAGVAYASPAAAPVPFAPHAVRSARMSAAAVKAGWPGTFPHRGGAAGSDREQYDRIDENPFVSVAAAPRSTFSLDVDRASYANVRRFLREGQRPPADAVRLEEFVNYFPYHAPDPQNGEALAVTTEVAPAPWCPDHALVRVALQARRPDPAALPPSNLVFLVDVSGSMFQPDKLPLVKQALGVLVSRLRPADRVALVAYAGHAGLVLPSTSGEDKARILAAIDQLEAGGSTAGGAGLELAYRVARDNAHPGANSRVILATDGDFNVGPSSDAEMERLIESKRAEGTYLTVLGFGEGNLQDAKMKKLAKRGNGNYAYVDDLPEAEKVFGQELGGTLVTVANDAKLQIEFNPAAVRAYRLLGYEGRLLRDEDFADDQKDAGDVGAGHTVTALYEVVPASAPAGDSARGVSPLRYGAGPSTYPRRAAGAAELLYVRLRYKRPGESASRLVTQVAYAPRARMRDEASADFRFASTVAEFGMLLRDSAHRGQASATQVLGIARGALGNDLGGHRAEFVGLVERWRVLGGGVVARVPD